VKLIIFDELLTTFSHVASIKSNTKSQLTINALLSLFKTNASKLVLDANITYYDWQLFKIYNKHQNNELYINKYKP